MLFQLLNATPEVDNITTIVSETLKYLGMGGGGLIMTTLVRILISKQFREFIRTDGSKFFKLLVGRPHYDHYLFANEKYLLFIIDNAKVGSPLKTDLFKTVLSIKVQTVVSYTKIWLTKRIPNLKNLDRIELQASMKRLIQFIIEGKDNEHIGYEKLIKRAFMDKYGDTRGLKYFNIVYTNGFKPYHEKNIHHIETFFNNMFFYTDNVKLVNMFLDKLHMALLLAVDDLIITFEKLNGSLEKL